MRKLFSIFVLSASLALAAPSTIVVQSGDTLGSIAARNGVSVQALLKANNLSATSTLKIGQVLKIPGGSSNQKTGSITVQSGDTLGSIAKRYGVSVATLRAANGLGSDNVSVGQVLRLSGTVQSSSKTSSVTAKASGGTVTVKSGDTLGEIAQQNGTTVTALKAANGLNSNNLKLGQVLKLSGPSQSSANSKTSSTTKTTSNSSSSKSSSGTVTVQAGDTLGEIAQANGTTVAALKATNGLIGNDLKLGQVLKLPGSSAVQSSATKSSTTGKTNTITSSKNATVTVKAGDSLSKIALVNGTTISALRAKNGLTNDDLKLGQALKLPSGNNPKPSNSSNTTTAKSPSLPSSVQVQKGDSLTKIAKQFGLSIETLRKLNNLKSDDLALGQTLRLKPAPVLAKTEKPSKPSSSSKPSTNKTVAKTDQNKPVTTTKPNTNKPSTTAAKPNSSTSSKPNSSTSKPTTANKPSSSTTANKPSKPATTNNSSQNKPSLAKTDISKPATNQKPITAQTSSSPTKPTAQVSSSPTKPSSNTKPTTQASLNTTKPSIATSKPSTTPQITTTPNPEVAVKPTPVKPATVSSNKPTPQPAIAAKPSQPIVSTQPPKPVMNEATVPETPVDTSTTQAPNSGDSNTSDPTAATDIAPSSSISTSPTQDSTAPATQTEQSQSNVGSDADYIIIEPQNSLEIVGQRTGSALSTLPATPPSNATPQQRAKYTRERLLWPLQGVLTSYYGYRRLRIGRSHFHTGLDIAAPSGTPVYAALSGRVEQAGWSRVGYGKLVIIRGWDGRRYYYGHNSRILVKTGQWINQGTMISKVGSTGYATGPHLHFEVRIGGHTRNPLAYLPRSQVQFARYAPKR